MTVKRALQWLLAAAFTIAGIMHFVNPGFYLPLMPPYLPWHLELVYLSGIAEIVFGVMLIIPGYQVLGAWGIIATLIAIFPANIHAAMLAGTPRDLFPDVSYAVQIIRLPFQALFIAWAYWYTKETNVRPTPAHR